MSTKFSRDLIKGKISKLDNEIKKSFDYANALISSVLAGAFNKEL